MTIYLFGKFANGYTQYPDDNTCTVLSNLYSKANAQTQIIIHRADYQMYYCYIRKLADQKYVGICILIVDNYITKIDELFSVFEKCIEQLSYRGSIIHFDKFGCLSSSMTKLCNESEDVSITVNNLKKNLEYIIQESIQLPPIDYSLDKDTINICSVNDNIQNIVKSSYTFGYTIILKEKDYETKKVNNYRSTLNRISKENVLLHKQILELKERNQQILRQKKQFRNIILLLCVVIGCGIGIYLLYNNLNSVQGKLNKANKAITERNSIISHKNNKITLLKNSIKSLQFELNDESSKRKLAEENLSTICNNYPFIVTSCRVDSESFSFDYYALEDIELSVTLRAVNDKNSEVVSNIHTLTFYKGGGSKTLYFNYKLDSSYYYYVVLMHNGNIIAGERW